MILVYQDFLKQIFSGFRTQAHEVRYTHEQLPLLGQKQKNV